MTAPSYGIRLRAIRPRQISMLAFQNSTNDELLIDSRYMDTPSQLDAGVRMVSGQVHKKDSEWHLCHSSCQLLDAGKLSSWLSEIKKWLDSNKNDGSLLSFSFLQMGVHWADSIVYQW